MINVYRGVAFRGRGCKKTRLTPLPHLLTLQFLNQTRSKSFTFKHHGYCFNECSDITRTRNFTIFTVYVTIFGQFMAAFHFFQLHSENRSLPNGAFKKVRYLTLELLESSLLWTIQRKTTVNKSLNIRSQAESWVYQKSPLKQEKHPS